MECMVDIVAVMTSDTEPEERQDGAGQGIAVGYTVES